MSRLRSRRRFPRVTSSCSAWASARRRRLRVARAQERRFDWDQPECLAKQLSPAEREGTRTREAGGRQWNERL
eukprot:5698247-Pleurochrysis_carterae.AAC.1